MSVICLYLVAELPVVWRRPIDGGYGRSASIYKLEVNGCRSLSTSVANSNFLNTSAHICTPVNVVLLLSTSPNAVSDYPSYLGELGGFIEDNSVTAYHLSDRWSFISSSDPSNTDNEASLSHHPTQPIASPTSWVRQQLSQLSSKTCRALRPKSTSPLATA